MALTQTILGTAYRYFSPLLGDYQEDKALGLRSQLLSHPHNLFMALTSLPFCEAEHWSLLADEVRIV